MEKKVLYLNRGRVLEELVISWLRRAGYKVVAVQDVGSVRTLFSEGLRVDLLITEIPSWGLGPELGLAIRDGAKAHPQLKVILIQALAPLLPDKPEPSHPRPDQEVGILHAPFTEQELLKLVQELLQEPEREPVQETVG